mmetsp:Transcript_36949/g.60140  ORF Transcript_36949/g.60140 Transcript_36949/m.60140 type:complete len:143 (+) Transcript_36949:546-974(+)
MGSYDTPASCPCWCSYFRFLLVSCLLVLGLVLGGDLSADAGVVVGLFGGVVVATVGVVFWLLPVPWLLVSGRSWVTVGVVFGLLVVPWLLVLGSFLGLLVSWLIPSGRSWIVVGAMVATVGVFLGLLLVTCLLLLGSFLGCC